MILITHAVHELRIFTQFSIKQEWSPPDTDNSNLEDLEDDEDEVQYLNELRRKVSKLMEDRDDNTGCVAAEKIPALEKSLEVYQTAVKDKDSVAIEKALAEIRR